MPTPPDAAQDNSKVITELLDRCKQLSESAESTIADCAVKQEPFLATNLEAVLRRLESILKILEEDLPGKAEAPAQDHSERRDLTIPTHGLQGNSWAIPLPDLLGFLASGRKTGLLWVDSPGEQFLIGLVNGQLMHATSNRTRKGERMGETLVSLGLLSPNDLDLFLPRAQDGLFSGEALLEQGVITTEQLQTALSHQAQRLFHRLINTKKAVFRFQEGLEIMLTHEMNLNIVQLILESARRSDEASRED